MWQIKRDGEVIAWGEKSSPPDSQECKRFRNDGYKVYIDGKEVKSGKAG